MTTVSMKKPLNTMTTVSMNKPLNTMTTVSMNKPLNTMTTVSIIMSKFGGNYNLKNLLPGVR